MPTRKSCSLPAAVFSQESLARPGGIKNQRLIHRLTTWSRPAGQVYCWKCCRSYQLFFQRVERLSGISIPLIILYSLTREQNHGRWRPRFLLIPIVLLMIQRKADLTLSTTGYAFKIVCSTPVNNDQYTRKLIK